MAYSELYTAVLSRELAKHSDALYEIPACPLGTKMEFTVLPPAPYTACIIHRFSYGMELPEDTGWPIAKLNRYAGASINYQTIASWTVTSGRKGTLGEVSMVSDNYAATRFRLTIGGVEQFTEQQLPAVLSLPFPRNELQAGSVVIIEARSTGVAIVANGSITGKEYVSAKFRVWSSHNKNMTDHTGTITSDIMREGIETWIYVDSENPLYFALMNQYGQTNEYFAAYLWLLNTQKALIPEIKKLAEQYGVRGEILPFVGGRS